jgi:GNAT superfamily N-acetyltransferase
MVPLRTATSEDIDALSATVAAAFASEAGWGYMLGPGNVDGMRAFARALLIPQVRRGTVWVTDDCLSLAMWQRRTTDSPLDEDHASIWAECRAKIGEEAWQRIATYDATVDASAPTRPYWYLEVLASHPDVQGHGRATALLQPGLEIADANGWDCWLETSVLANKNYYEARGFTESREFVVPGGPTTWWMRRPFGL